MVEAVVKMIVDSIAERAVAGKLSTAFKDTGVARFNGIFEGLKPRVGLIYFLHDELILLCRPRLQSSPSPCGDTYGIRLSVPRCA